MDIVLLGLKLLLAYIVGSIPTGLILGKVFYKKDLRDFGSRNIGATNAYRVLGLIPALIVFMGDFFKGFMGVYLFYNDPLFMVIGGLLSIVGHSWSIFLLFKGGKGVATGLGVLTGLSPYVALIALIIWILLVGLSKYVSLGSIVAALSVPLDMYLLDEPNIFIWFGLIIALFIVYRHKENIKRLLKGEELKVKRL